MTPGRQCGAIGVLVRDAQYLVIQRSATVRAPGKLCFPGGAIEQGETEQQAVVRELREELHLDVTPIRRLWQSETATRVQLYWWLVELASDCFSPQPNPAEVAGWFWMTAQTMTQHPQTLPTNLAFLDAVRAGDVTLQL